MPNDFLQSAVGCGGMNAKHDVALLQAALKSIPNPAETRNDRTYWPHTVSGMKDLALEEAIKAFQAGSGLSVTGCVRPGDNTERKLRDLLPRERRHMRCFANSTDVYCFNPQGRLQTGSLQALEDDPDLPPQLAAAVRQWLQNYQTSQGKTVLVEKATVRPNSVDFALKFEGITLLDVNAKPIRGRTTTPAEIAAMNAANGVNFQYGVGAKAVMRDHHPVVEIAFDTASELTTAIERILNTPSYRYMSEVIGGFSKTLEEDIHAGVRQEVEAIRKHVDGAGGPSVRGTLDELGDYGKAVGKATANELDQFAGQVARELKATYGSLSGLIRDLAGGAERVASRRSVDVDQQQSAMIDAIAKAASKVGLDGKKLGLFLEKFGRRFFLFSMAISIYKIFAAEDKVEAIQGEAVSILVDAAIAGAVTVAVAVFTSSAIAAIVLGLVVALLAGDQIDAAKAEILDLVRSIPSGPIFAYARD